VSLGERIGCSFRPGQPAGCRTERRVAARGGTRDGPDGPMRPQVEGELRADSEQFVYTTRQLFTARKFVFEGRTQGNRSAAYASGSCGDGNTTDRVLAAIDSGGKSYVAAIHWPRSWYNQAIASPKVPISLGDDRGVSHTAVPVCVAVSDRR
jgi:hypothetical protein